jgi:hypothetical protein
MIGGCAPCQHGARTTFWSDECDQPLVGRVDGTVTRGQGASFCAGYSVCVKRRSLKFATRHPETVALEQRVGRQ